MGRHVLLKWGILILIVLLLILYKIYNPEGNNYFPKCPFRVITGYECPGCGSQRAIHQLLNLNIIQAAKENILLVIAIPYLLVGFWFDVKKELTPKQLIWRKRLYGKKAIIVILIIIISFWIIRNIIH